MTVHLKQNIEGKITSYIGDGPNEITMWFDGIGKVSNIYEDEVRSVLGGNIIKYKNILTFWNLMYIEGEDGNLYDFHIVTCRR